MFSVSRSTHSSGICGSTSTDWDFPLSVKLMAIKTSAQIENRRPHANPTGLIRKAAAKTRIQLGSAGEAHF
jgi:hypothetical protein